MDSDEDIHPQNDGGLYGGDAEDDSFYGGDTDEAPADYYGDGDPDYSNDISSRRPQQNYTVLEESDIIQRQENDITEVCAVPSVSRVAAAILLRHYNWSVSKVHDALFADEEKVRKTVGILEDRVGEALGCKKELLCGICFEFDYGARVFSAGCGHPYCGECWTGYITASIGDGLGCLMLRCPEPSCAAAIGRDMIDKFASDEDKEKYSRYIVRSYVEEGRRTIKWCPAPGCKYAVEFQFVAGSKNFDVCCLCSHRFCWNCTEEAHRPVDCETVAKWVLKNSMESGNLTWLLANSKLCPKCKIPIEKNHGCMHMSCRPPCRFEFCWLCLGPWSEHSHFNSCNRYERPIAITDDSAKEERRREMAKNSLDRYNHYYERWDANERSRAKAIADLHKAQTKHIDKLVELQRQPLSQLTFIIEAWKQIIECRGVLKWTYAFGYYLPEQEHGKKQLFEYLQEEAESGLERLHQCAEKELERFLDDKRGWRDGFKEFQSKLAGLTSVTKNYFENLVRALENGLEDVHSCSEQRTQGEKVAILL